MTWLELVQQMQAAGFSPGEACILASMAIAVGVLGRRVQVLEGRQEKSEADPIPWTG